MYQYAEHKSDWSRFGASLVCALQLLDCATNFVHLCHRTQHDRGDRQLQPTSLITCIGTQRSILEEIKTDQNKVHYTHVILLIL